MMNVRIRGPLLLASLALAGCSHPPAAKSISPLGPTNGVDTKGEQRSLQKVLATCAERPDQIFCRLNCGYAEIICLLPSGAPIPSEVIPASLDPKTTIQIYVVTKTADIATSPQIRITEVIGSESSEKALVKTDAPASAWLDVGDNYSARATSFTMASEAESERFDILDQANSEQKRSTFRIHSNGGRYYYSFGPMLAVPWTGTQKITSAQPPDGSGERYLRTHDNDPVPALVAHVYPFGHRAKSSSPFQNISFRNFFSDLLSVEAGVSLDPTKAFDHLFAGAALEPITGFTFSMGVGIHRAERYQGGYIDGAFPATNRASAVEEFAQVAGYCGFGLNQKIFSTLMKAFSSSSDNQQSSE